MRRFVSILMLALYSSTLLLAAARPSTEEAKLPPCCRRDGKHGCGMKMKSAPGSAGTAWRTNASCEQYGKGAATPAAAKDFLVSPDHLRVSPLVSDSATLCQAETPARTSFHGSRYKRGPPTLLV